MSSHQSEAAPEGDSKPIIPAGLQVQILTDQAEKAFEQLLKEEARMGFLSRANRARNKGDSGMSTKPT